jgi:polyisoprenoid-binding protein YceI
MTKLLISMLGLLAVITATAGELQLDKQNTTIEAVAKATGHHFSAIPEEYECHITLDDQNQNVSAAHFSFKLEDLRTGKPKRDREMLEWLESERYPSLEFRTTRVTQAGDQQVLHGEVSLHNVTHEIEIPVVLSKDGEAMLMSGDFQLTTTDFGLKKIRKMMMLTVNPVLNIHLEVRGTVIETHAAQVIPAN